MHLGDTILLPKNYEILSIPQLHSKILLVDSLQIFVFDLQRMVIEKFIQVNKEIRAIMINDNELKVISADSNFPFQNDISSFEEMDRD